MKVKNNKDDCTELKNIKYQNMLLSNSKVSGEVVENINNIDIFLKKEKDLNNKKPWNKLGKSSKIKLVKIFVEEYSKKNKLSTSNEKKMLDFLKICIDRKKLHKIKDIDYDKDNAIIKSIPILLFNKTNNKFTLKRSDKKKSALDSLPPSKTKKRIRKKSKKTAKTTNKSPTQSKDKLSSKKQKQKKQKMLKMIKIK